MKKLFKAAAVFVTAFSLMGSAVAAPCVPVAPSDIEAKMQVAWPGDQSLSSSYFLQNSCDWAGHDQLNGLDGVVLDVESIAGIPASMIAKIGNGPFAIALVGRFLDSDCAPIEGSDISQNTNGESYSVEIPADAKWMIITPTGTNPTADINITLHSDGRVCKKKKKK